MLHVLGVLQRIGCCQVASQGVPHQNHFVQPLLLPPSVQGRKKEGLSVQTVAGLEVGSPCSMGTSKSLEA